MVLRYKNLIIIGTSHIARQSYKEVRHLILTEMPGIIALELDKQRLAALMSKERPRPNLALIKHIGLKGYLFTLIGSYIQKKLGSKVGVLPGEEMKEAIRLAQKLQLRLALIDQDILVTMKEFSKTFTWKERFRFIADVFKGIFFKKKQLKKYGLENLDLSKVPSQATINKLIQDLKYRYPNIYKSLIVDRNRVMAKNLTGLMKHFPDKKILAIVGAGHEEAILKLVKTKYIKTSTT
ncbi:hypothetical protein DRJ17_02015 [Candidatus Woesearchaeota archaeon]|nr:MAG: hypothetical protein DRJ17_02015 [Candidatus Woesearchaeota archaeon]